MTVIRELFVKLGFVVDDKALGAADQKLANFKKTAAAAGSAGVDAFARPRDELGKFVKYKDSVFAGAGGKGILGGYQESLGLITEAAGSAKNMVLGLAGAFAVNSLALGGFFKIVGNFEQTEIAFETLIGDAEKAHKTLQDLKNFAKTTPFNFADVSDLSKRLLAFSFTAEDLIPTMTALGNIAAGVGKDKLPQLVLALGQVKAAGKLRGSELRQFTEAGVPLIAELAKSLGIADAQVQQMVENGKVGFKDVYKALQNVSGEGGRFNNLMARQSTSLLGIVSNIVDTVQLLAVDLGNRGLLKSAKEFTLNVLAILEANKDQILLGMQHAIELLISALDKTIMIVKGAWRVFQGLTQIVGGTRRALDLMIKGLFLITSARMLWLLGKMAIGIAGLARAWLFAGNAAFMAQLKMAAIPLAIGAAIAALALIVEDVVAYFQGRKSITGIILKDLDGLTGGIDKIMGPIFDKVKAFGATIGKSIIDGIANLSEADWARVGEYMLKALAFIGKGTEILFNLGVAIADGILSGIIQGLTSRFPKIAEFLGLTDTPAGNANAAGPNAKGLSTPVEQRAWDMLKGLAQMALPASMASPDFKYSPTPPPVPPSAKPIQVNAVNNITVPPGTPPEAVGPAVTKGVKDGIQGYLRETSRATAPAVSY